MVKIRSVVSEKKIFEKVYADDDADDADGRKVIAKAHMVKPCELKMRETGKASKRQRLKGEQQQLKVFPNNI